MDSNRETSQGRNSMDSLSCEEMRTRAADLVFEQRYSVLSRIRLLLGNDARKITDTEDILSTALRRIDRVINRGRLQAMTEAQFFAFVHAVIRRTILEKSRNSRRLKARESGASQVQLNLRTELNNSKQLETEWIERIGQLITDPIDREVILLKGREHSFVEIAEVIHMTPEAVRQRWSRIKATLREQFAEGLDK